MYKYVHIGIQNLHIYVFMTVLWKNKCILWRLLSWIKLCHLIYEDVAQPTSLIWPPDQALDFLKHPSLAVNFSTNYDIVSSYLFLKDSGIDKLMSCEKIVSIFPFQKKRIKFKFLQVKTTAIFTKNLFYSFRNLDYIAKLFQTSLLG